MCKSWQSMLNKAFEQFPSTQGLIMHSDQGWQYQHVFYRNELQKHGITQSMSRKLGTYQTAPILRFFCFTDDWEQQGWSKQTHWSFGQYGITGFLIGYFVSRSMF